jgi:mono/diheme cytochrome c family protein
MHSGRALRALTAVALALFAACAASLGGVGSAFAASADKGKAAFVQHGCWQCHGFNGQSTVTSSGRVIARTALSLDAFKSFVRGSNGAMPPYRPPVLSDGELDDIYAYLQAIPQPKPPGAIPLLGEMRSQ